MDAKKVWCEVIEGAVWSDRCLFKLSKVIEGNASCETCPVRELEILKRCIKKTEFTPVEKTEAVRRRKSRTVKHAKGIKKTKASKVTDVSNDTNISNDRKEPRPVTEDTKQPYSVAALGKLLGKPKRRIQELAQKGKIPGRKVGRHWEFLKEEIEKWLPEKKEVSLQRGDVVKTHDIVMTQGEPSNDKKNPRAQDQSDEG